MSTTTSGPLKVALFPRSTALTNALFVVGGIGFLGALAHISIPVPGSPVPVTGQTLGVMLIGTTFGAMLGFTTFALYLLMGIAGAPLFAPNGTSQNFGVERITSPTGGYLVGMLLASYILGYLADRKADQKFSTSFPALLLGNVIIFSLGLFWLQTSLDISWSKAIALGLTPFIFGEALKIAIAATSLPIVWKFTSRKLNR